MNPKSRAVRVSVLLSYVFSGIFVLLLLALSLLLPRLVPILLSVPDLMGEQLTVTEWETRFILLLSYLAIAVAFVAVGFLVSVLRSVAGGFVFANPTVRALYAVAICCLFEGLIFLIIGFRFQLALLLFAMACFLSLCLYIVGNVLLLGMDYKAENDLTI